MVLQSDELIQGLGCHSRKPCDWQVGHRQLEPVLCGGEGTEHSNLLEPPHCHCVPQMLPRLRAWPCWLGDLCGFPLPFLPFGRECGLPVIVYWKYVV